MRKATPLAPTESPRIRTQPIDTHRFTFEGTGSVLDLSCYTIHSTGSLPLQSSCRRLFCENSGTSRPPQPSGGVQVPRCAGGDGGLSSAQYASLVKMYLARCGLFSSCLTTYYHAKHSYHRSLLFLFRRLATYPGLYK